MSSRPFVRGLRTLLLVAGCVLSALGATGTAGAQDTAANAQSVKLAVIDVQRILTDSKSGKEALARLEKLRDAKNNELLAKQQQATDLRDQIAKGRLSLSEDRLSEMQKQLEDTLISLRRLQDDADRELQKSQEETFAAIEKGVLPVINQVGQEMGFTLIFNKFQSGLLYAKDGVDITDLILQRLDQKAGGGG